MVYHFEREPDPSGRSLKLYRVVDNDRDLRLELKRRDQNQFEFWFWQKRRCFPLFVKQLAGTPGVNEIVLSVVTERLRDRETGAYIYEQEELDILRSLIREGLEAFWRLRKTPDTIGKLTVVDCLVVKRKI